MDGLLDGWTEGESKRLAVDSWRAKLLLSREMGKKVIGDWLLGREEGRMDCWTGGESKKLAVSSQEEGTTKGAKEREKEKEWDHDVFH